MSRGRTLILLGVSVLVALLLSCGLGAAAIHQGFAPPPDIKLTFGGVRLVSGISTLPDCARLLTPGCSSLHPEPTVWIYTIWLLWHSGSDVGDSTHVVRLFSTQLKRGE